MTSLATIKANYESAQERMKADGKVSLHAAFKEFFTKHPEVTDVMWVQYTPHFNDGDACVFSVYDREVHVKKEWWSDELYKEYAQYTDEEDDGHEGYHHGELDAIYALRGNPTAIEQALLDDWDQLKPAFQMEELFQFTFGDHVLVKATAAGFEVTEYEHD